MVFKKGHPPYGFAKGGLKLSEEVKRKLSKARKGKHIGNENSFFGKHHSKESKIKMSLSKKGKSNPNISKVLKRLYSEGKLISHNKGKHLSEETKKRMSETKRKLFLEGKYKKHSGQFKKGQSPWNKGKQFSKESKRKLSETRKRLFVEGKLSPSRYWLGKKQSFSHIEKVRKTSIEHWKNPEFRAKTIKNTKDALNRLETRKKLSKSSKAMWQNPIIREKLLHRIIPFKDTSIEVKLQQELTKLGIKYEKHKFILGQPDIFIEPNICIFADGCYWHGCERCFDRNKFTEKQRVQIVRDQFVTQGLQNSGYIVLRFWEHEINNDIESVMKRILECYKKEAIIVVKEKIQ